MSSTCAGSVTESTASRALRRLRLEGRDQAAPVAAGRRRGGRRRSRVDGDLGVSGLELAAGTALAKVTESVPARARGTLTAVGASAQAAP